QQRRHCRGSAALARPARLARGTGSPPSRRRRNSAGPCLLTMRSPIPAVHPSHPQDTTASTRKTTMTLLRLSKTALVASLALFFALVAFGNITDYDSNWQFVRHVLAMDTIFPGSSLTWRAITDERLQRLAYFAIIAAQFVAALVLWLATF